MLKNFKPVNLILVVGAMALPVSAYADLVPETRRKYFLAERKSNGSCSG